MEDEKNHHGALDKSSSEQQFHKSDVITFVVWKIWSHTPSATGSYGRPAGRQADEIQANFNFFKIRFRVKYLNFAGFNKGYRFITAVQMH